MNNNSCKTDIINRALSLLREHGIVDGTIEPSTDSERLVNMWWDIALNECLIDIVPPFAIKRSVLAREKIVNFLTLEEIKKQNVAEKEEEEIDANNVLYVYRIPSDCLRILNNKKELNEIINDNFIIEGNYIYSTTNNNYNLRYLCSVKELFEREAKFNLCLSYCLAYYVCADLTNNDSKIQLFLKLKNIKMVETRTYYQKQIGVKFIKQHKWVK